MNPVLKSMLALMLFAAPVAAQAGIDFASIPVGCSWSKKYSDGRTLIETYVGKKSGTYLTETADKKAPGKILNRTAFDKKGRMIRKDWAGGHWETFKPFSCFDVTGVCTYSYKNGDGGDFVIENTTQAEGKGFKVVAAPKGGEPYPDEYFELGRFNLMKVNKASNYSAKLTGFTNCETANS